MSVEKRKLGLMGWRCERPMRGHAGGVHLSADAWRQDGLLSAFASFVASIRVPLELPRGWQSSAMAYTFRCTFNIDDDSLFQKYDIVMIWGRQCTAHGEDWHRGFICVKP